MHSKLEALPLALDAAGAKCYFQSGFGGMTASFWKMSSVDSRPMVKGLQDDCCPCPHWGFMLKGSMRVVYNDGSEEIVKAGDMFYFPAGHNAFSSEEISWIEFSPEEELRHVMDHLAEQMQAV